MFYRRTSTAGKPPNYFYKTTIDATKKPNVFVETTSKTKNMTALFVPTGKSKTDSVIHSLGVVDGETVGIYGTKLLAPTRAQPRPDDHGH